MLLELNGIDVNCIIGDLPEERVSPQNLLVDLRLGISDKAAKSDLLEDTVDYAKLTEIVRATLITAKCHLIERAANLVASAILNEAIAKPRDFGRAGVPSPATVGGGTPTLPDFAITSNDSRIQFVEVKVTKVGSVPHLHSASVIVRHENPANQKAD